MEREYLIIGTYRSKCTSTFHIALFFSPSKKSFDKSFIWPKKIKSQLHDEIWKFMVILNGEYSLVKLWIRIEAMKSHTDHVFL